MSRTLGAISHALGGTLVGSSDQLIDRLAPLGTAGATDLAFVAQARYASQISTTRAACLIVPPALQEVAAARGACIVSDNPYLYFARVTQWWRREHEVAEAPSIHPLASVHPSAQLGHGVHVGPYAVIGAEVSVAQGCRIGAHAVLDSRAQLGAGTVLHARATVGRDCHIGERCILHPGAVVGADGFGFAQDGVHWVKIEHLGAVRIGDDVEIGANTCIDRGALDDTVIENGVKLDNLIQIGHNVRVGANTAMAGCVGVAGSAIIGANCTVGGGAVILGHLTLADGVHISASSVVTRSISMPGHYTGMFPIDDNAKWEKNAASLKQLNRLRERLKAVELSMVETMKSTNKP